MSASVRLARLIALCLATMSAAWPALAQSEPGWRIENRFRLFRDAARFQVMETVWNDLRLNGKASAFQFERSMQEHAAARTPGHHFAGSYDTERYGWTAPLLGPLESCFDPSAGGYFRCRLQNGELLMEPRTTEILISPGQTLSTRLAGQFCIWRAGTQSRQLHCDRDARFAGIPFATAFDIVIEHQGAVVARLDRQIAQHKFVAGFGDSFASGEGNPDKPVDLQDFYTRNFQGEGTYPLRPGATDRAFGGPGAAPRFQHQQCHRSLYSSQLRAALSIALAEPHVAITYLGYACSGAKTPDLFKTFYEGWKDVPNATYDDAPQLAKFHRDFCRRDLGYRRVPTRRKGETTITPCPEEDRRPHPDAILLSTGGNDIGFAKVVAHETLIAPENFSDLLFKFVPKLSPDEARQTAPAILRQNFQAFSDALAQHITTPRRSIIQTGYPYVTTAGQDRFCGAGDAGMDIHHLLEISNPVTGSTISSLVIFLNREIEKTLEQLPDDRRWTFIRPSLAAFVGHAICQGGAPAGVRDGAMSGDMRSPDDVGQAGISIRWVPFRPSAWRAYRERNRWFHTPNDAFLTINYMRYGSSIGEPRSIDDRILPLLASTVGAFHPNNWGHAAIADGIIPTLRSALDLP